MKTVIEYIIIYKNLLCFDDGKIYLRGDFMHYALQLNFLKQVLQKMHLHSSEYKKNEVPDYNIDFGLRHFLDIDQNYDDFFLKNFKKMNSNTIYKLTDLLGCSYIMFLLPQEDEETIFVIGPFSRNVLTHEFVLEIAERVSVPPSKINEFESSFSYIPFIGDSDKIPLFTMVNVLGEIIWGGETSFEIVDSNEEIIQLSATASLQENAQKQQDILLEMQNMESRYAFENDLIESVAKGQSNRASLMLESISNHSFALRTTDTLRNAKNYCVICNTLLRKAAEKGGVHPIYLNKSSSILAEKIELLTDVDEAKAIMREMIQTYCRLVRKHSFNHYSPPIQKTLAYIDADLTNDLSLRALSSLQKISSSYLSALFKKETGQTITDYVNNKRVQRAIHLLSTTKLQIQTISQYCGISDVNYFSKIFKKYTNQTPKEFRKNPQIQIRH